MPTIAADPGGDSDSSITWEDFFGTTTAEDLVPTLLNMYDTLIGRPTVAIGDAGGGGVRIEPTPQRPKEPPPPPPPPLVSTSTMTTTTTTINNAAAGKRPLSVTSIASSSSSSSSVTSSCSGRRRLPSKAYLASIESLEDSEDEAPPSSSASKAGSHGSQDSGVCSPCSFISSPSPPHSKPRYCDPHLSYMDRVVMEIIETEGVYVSDLRQVIVGYIERWESCMDCQLSDKQMFDLFGNLRQIYTFNSSFLKELEQCGLDPVKVARVFVKNNAGFSIYTDYCTNYPKTVSVLTELMRQESAVRLFRERQSALNHTLPLGSYLLKPVQRILKYHLLLQNMVKGSRPDVDGYGDIVDALTAMTSIAHHINDMKRRHEHAVRVQEIQSLLLGWQGEDLTTYGELCAEGTFRMAGAKALRHAFLFDQILLITKKKEEGILGYKAHIMCSNLMLIESVPGEPLSFHVIPFDNPRHQYTLQARSLEQKREWTLQLKRVILENYNAVIPSHARQLVMQLGQNRTDDEIMADRTTPKKQHSAPEYLERRKQERERRKSESGLRAKLRTRSRKAEGSILLKVQQTRDQLRRGSEAPSEEGVDMKSDDVKVTDPESEANMTLSSAELHISETDLSENGGQNSPLVAKKRSLEEIVSQLLMENKQFQRVLKKQRHLASRRHHTPHPLFQTPTSRTETSDDEDDDEDEDEGSRDRLPHLRSSRSLTGQREGDYDNLHNVWETARDLENGALKRAQSFTSQRYEDSSTANVSLSSSDTSFDVPTSPAVWLKQQRAHLAAPTTPTKAGSLPRGFQLGGPPDWQHKARVSPDRPFTIASDKAQELNLDDMQRYCDSQHDKLTRHRFPLPDDTTEDDSTPDASTQQLNVHPEYKIYRPSLTKATLKQVISSVSSKLAHLRLSSETLDQLDDSHNRANRFMTAFAKTFAKKRSENESNVTLPVYKQGSSALGARLAQGNENSDYADPRSLFPNITGSRKAAALLGIRPYSALSLGSSLSSGYASHHRYREEIETVESDGSADSFYERSFEAIETTMSHDVCRDSAIFSETDDSEPHSVTISSATKVKLMKRTPPPVPDKPPNLRLWRPPLAEPSSLLTPPLASPQDEYDSSSVASTVIETSPTKGWVKHIIGKIQGEQLPVSPNS